MGSLVGSSANPSAPTAGVDTPIGGGGGGGGGVTSLTAGPNISLSGATGNVAVTGTGNVAVATHAALLALDCTNLSEGCACVVESLNAAIWDLVPSTVAAFAFINVAALNKAGFQWRRRIIRNPIAEVQGTWVVDGANVSGVATDDGPGTALVPLRTMQELSRRLADAMLSTAVAVTVLSSTQNTDVTKFTFNLQGSAVVTFTGALTVAYTGSLTSVPVVPGAAPTTGDYEIADAAVTGGSFTAAGLLANAILFQRTNGTACAWWAAKDLGSTTLRTSSPQNTATFAPIALANGDTYTASSMPQLFGLAFRGVRPAGVIIKNCEIRYAAVGVGQPDPVQYTQCWFSVGQSWGASVFINCAFSAAAFFRGGVGSDYTYGFLGGMFRGTGGTVFTFISSAEFGWTMAPTVWQGATCIYNGANVLYSVDALFYDNTAAGGAIQGLYWTTIMFFTGVLGGSNNTGAVFLQASKWSQVAYSPGVLMLAGTSTSPTPIQVGGSAIAVAALPVGVSYAGPTSGCGIYQSA